MVNKVNRGNQISRISPNKGGWKDISISLYDIDQAVAYYISDIIHPQISDGDGNKIDIPILYASPERWKAIRKDQSFRDKKGQIQCPLIVYKRTEVARNADMYIPKMSVDDPQLFHTFNRKYSSKNKYTKFSKLTRQKPIIEQMNVVIPRYVTINYDIIIWTDYLEQMNKTIEVMDYHSGTYWGNEKFKFKTNIENYSDSSEVSTDTSRIIKSEFSMELKGYILPDIYAKHLPNTKSYSVGKIIMDEKIISEDN